MVVKTGLFGFGCHFRKCLPHRDFLKQRQAQDLQNYVETQVELQFLLDDGNEGVHTDCDPDFRFHRVGCGAVERLDSQMQFDSL